MSKIGEYTVLTVNIPPTSAYPKPATQTIYLRPHAPKIPTESDSRSLFLVNVPIDTTATHLRGVFTSLLGVGRVEDVTFEHEKKAIISKEIALLNTAGQKNKKRKRGAEEVDLVSQGLPPIWDRDLRKSGSTAVVVLVDEKNVENALKAIRKLHKSGKEMNWPIWGEGIEDKVPALGSARYVAHQKLRYPDPQVLQRNVDAFMTAFNLAEEEKAKQAKKARNVPDEDGFVTVTRGGRVGPARREEAEEKRKEVEEREKRKRESMGNFYRFQIREKRKEQQGELVRRFEEDRRKVEGMRERRGKFRPES
jgi:ribosomal RNA-processing protein 7